ncbi:MAG: hypothetical protein AB7H90_03755 [Alphaproteobacteria bacterium]
MMRRRGFYSLLSIGVALVAAAVVGLVLGSRGPAPPPPPKPVFPGLADRLDGLAWIRVARGAAKVDFANVAGRWVVIDKDNYPAASDRVRRLLLGLAELTLVEPDAPDTGGPAPIDRDGAAAGEPTLIALRGRTGETVAEAIVADAPGKAAEGGAGTIHVRAPGAERTVPARGSLDVPGNVLGWLDRGIVDIPPARIASLTLTGADGAMLTARRDIPDAEFAIAELPEGTRLTGDAELSDLAGTLAGLAFDDVRPLALVELPENGLARAEFVTFDGLAVALRLFAHEGADWIAVAVAGTGAVEAESNALNTRLARWVYAIPAARAKLLRTRLDDLTDPAKG